MTKTAIQLPQIAPAKLIHSLTWEQFEELDRSLENFAGVRLAYLDGTAEIMTLSPEHEHFKSTVRRLLAASLEEQDIRFYSRGGPSLGDTLGARNELAESYNLNAPKSYPDLVIEVVITSGGTSGGFDKFDKLEGYRRMGVQEVWFWEDGVLKFHSLQPDGYQKHDRSALLPNLPVEAFCRYVIPIERIRVAKGGWERCPQPGVKPLHPTFICRVCFLSWYHLSL